MFPETIQLFHDYRIEEVLAAPQAEYGHHFGGPILHEGLSENECGFPVHLICNLNSRDPLVELALPNAQWLPLYYCFSYENQSMSMGYRVLSDQRIEAFFNNDERIDLGNDRFPGDDFPAAFPVTPLQTQSVTFDPTKVQDVSSYVNAFGIANLSLTDQQSFLKDCKQSWDKYAPEPWTGPLEELLDHQTGPACQGPPNSECANPNCANHTKKRELELFAVVPATPVPKISLWGEWGDDTQILFEICPLCFTIVVTNQCT
ncbi:MAG: hypothetical protein HON53_22285 [Planctomycetaceae bacterium]|nr:hypothetical protein [Planctomycetaceae bacterium]MBT6157121.1 hypothetical protein [Planctomycetaceae bacterium]MBT6483652.1 hypothetical protein [Planctomycetaceae bacterium]MBT6497075.1 hypothetical protein [Planctomycetaceae bacterium]